MFEKCILELARKSVESPKRLAPEDLEPLRSVVGAGAVTYTVVAGSFHFINRMADLLRVDPEALPEGLRRFDTLRRASVRVAALVFRGIDLANRPYRRTYDEAIEDSGHVIEEVLDGSLEDRLDVLRERPQAIEVLRLALEERDRRSSLSRDLLARIHRGVEDALPAHREQASGFHSRPRDPVDTFVFVGTRYPARTTRSMIDALRSEGFDDLGVLDLATAVADANQWARTYRLLGLDPALFYLDESRSECAEAIET